MASTQQDSVMCGSEETTPKDQAASQKDANVVNIQELQRAYYFGGDAEDSTAKPATGSKHFSEAADEA